MCLHKCFFLFPLVVGEVCSHTRVHDLFLESLQQSTPFLATKCLSYGEIYAEKCSEHGGNAVMGGDFNNNINRPLGIYYLQTHGKSPFAIQILLF